MDVVRIATRGSLLAKAQAQMVKSALAAFGVESETVIVTTKGDLNRKDPLKEIGGNGLFVREIEKALLQNEADIAVHCGKDLPFEINQKLKIAGVLKAGDPRDCLVTIKDRTMPDDPVIGTGSPRRILEYRRFNPCVRFKDIRGNVNTRIEKLKAGEYDGIILAKAGLDRLEIRDEDLEINVFDTAFIIPAPCQGILAMQCREDDGKICDLIGKITDRDTMDRFTVERDIFCTMGADCSKAVGIYAKIDDGFLDINVMYEENRVRMGGLLQDHEMICEDICEALKESE